MTRSVEKSGPFNTGRVGFGCAYITGGFEKQRNIRILKAAFDNGIRHYDTAPSYGHGTSENVVGEAFKGLREQISIATKVGICRPSFSLRTKLLRLVATPVRHQLPKLSQRSAAVMYRNNAMRKDFTAEGVRRSVEESMSRLATEYLDVLLLHEVAPDDISDELLTTLGDLKRSGRVLRVGIGSSGESIAAIDAKYPEHFDVYQRTWSILRSDEGLYQNKINIYHRAIAEALDRLQEELASDFSLAESLRCVCGLDLEDANALPSALMRASTLVNPNGITLFGTRRPSRVREYARAALAERALGDNLIEVYRQHAGACVQSS